MSISKLNLSLLTDIIFLLIFAFVIGCSDNSVADGGGTDVFNATISGKITSTDSIEVVNSVVKLLPSDFNPLIDNIDNQAIDTLDETGLYSVIANDSGAYNLYVKSPNSTYASLIRNIIITSDSSYEMSTSLDSMILQKIILPGDVYGHGSYLGFIGTDIYQGIPNMYDTIEIYLPADTLPPLQIIWPDGTLGDTLIETFITTDTIIEISDSNSVINTAYIPFDSLDSPNEAPIKLLNDSLGNVWVLFKTGITMLKDSGAVITKSNFFDRTILLLSVSPDAEINDGAFDAEGNLWICSNGSGLYKHSVNNNGILSGFQYNTTNSSFLSSDTVYTIDFKDSLTLVTQPSGLYYGVFSNDSVYDSLMGYPNCFDAVFLSDTGILFISSILNLYNFTSKGVDVYPFDFSSTFNITSFTPISNSLVYIGTNDVSYTADKKVTFFNSNSNSWNYYNLYVISPELEIRSSAKDKNGDEWFGTENGQIIYLPDQNENNEFVFTDINSSIPSNAFTVNNMIVSDNNLLYATVDTLGVVLFDIDSK